MTGDNVRKTHIPACVPPDNLEMQRALSLLFLQAQHFKSAAKQESTDVWYCVNIHVGINTLGRLVGDACAEVGIEGYFTKSSGRAFLANMLSGKDIPHSIAMLYTKTQDRRSIQGLHSICQGD